eukprot:274032_1
MAEQKQLRNKPDPRMDQIILQSAKNCLVRKNLNALYKFALRAFIESLHLGEATSNKWTKTDLLDKFVPIFRDGDIKKPEVIVRLFNKCNKYTSAQGQARLQEIAADANTITEFQGAFEPKRNVLSEIVDNGYLSDSMTPRSTPLIRRKTKKTVIENALDLATNPANLRKRIKWDNQRNRVFQRTTIQDAKAERQLRTETQRAQRRQAQLNEPKNASDEKETKQNEAHPLNILYDAVERKKEEIKLAQIAKQKQFERTQLEEKKAKENALQKKKEEIQLQRRKTLILCFEGSNIDDARAKAGTLLFEAGEELKDPKELYVLIANQEAQTHKGKSHDEPDTIEVHVLATSVRACQRLGELLMITDPSYTYHLITGAGTGITKEKSHGDEFKSDIGSKDISVPKQKQNKEQEVVETAFENDDAFQKELNDEIRNLKLNMIKKRRESVAAGNIYDEGHYDYNDQNTATEKREIIEYEEYEDDGEQYDGEQYHDVEQYDENNDHYANKRYKRYRGGKNRARGGKGSGGWRGGGRGGGRGNRRGGKRGRGGRNNRGWNKNRGGRGRSRGGHSGGRGGYSGYRGRYSGGSAGGGYYHDDYEPQSSAYGGRSNNNYGYGNYGGYRGKRRGRR